MHPFTPRGGKRLQRNANFSENSVLTPFHAEGAEMKTQRSAEVL